VGWDGLESVGDQNQSGASPTQHQTLREVGQQFYSSGSRGVAVGGGIQRGKIAISVVSVVPTGV